jgi:hypothetical protein
MKYNTFCRSKNGSEYIDWQFSGEIKETEQGVKYLKINLQE